LMLINETVFGPTIMPKRRDVRGDGEDSEKGQFLLTTSACMVWT